MSFFFGDAFDCSSPVTSDDDSFGPPSWSPSSSTTSSSPSTPEHLDATRLPDIDSILAAYGTASSKRRGKPLDHIPRPPNAFVLFRAALARQLKGRPIENDQRHISQITSAAWRRLETSEKAMWYERADAVKRAHAQQHPGYRFRPVTRTQKPRKRNVKRNGPKDKERSLKLGELISKGMSLHELESVAKKMDATMKEATERAESEETRKALPDSNDFTTTVFDSKFWEAKATTLDMAIDLLPLRSPLLPPVTDETAGLQGLPSSQPLAGLQYLDVGAKHMSAGLQEFKPESPELSGSLFTSDPFFASTGEPSSMHSIMDGLSESFHSLLLPPDVASDAPLDIAIYHEPKSSPEQSSPSGQSQQCDAFPSSWLSQGDFMQWYGNSWDDGHNMAPPVYRNFDDATFFDPYQ